MTTKYEIEGESLEDAIRQLIDQAAGGDVDVHLRTRGYDPRATGPTTLRAEVDDAETEAAPPAPAREERSETRASQESSSRSRAGRNGDGRAREEEDDVVVTADDLEAEADAAADFLEGLLDALQVPGDLQIRVLDDSVEVEVVEADSGTLIGRRGQTLEAIQELARCSLQREFQRRTRVLVDVEGYRARRLEKLLDKADEAIDEALDSGESVRLEPMDVFERRAVHQLVNEVDGVESRSTGREPDRRIIIEAS